MGKDNNSVWMMILKMRMCDYSVTNEHNKIVKKGQINVTHI